MSDDPDFPKANHALQVLRQDRLSRNEAAAIMLGDSSRAQSLRTPRLKSSRSTSS
jgi:hypothetical protein